MTTTVSSNNQVYRAPAPRQIAPSPASPIYKKIFSAVSSFFLFPIDKILTRVLLPATQAEGLSSDRANALQQPQTERVRFSASDGAPLDGMIRRGALRKAVLYVGGNAEAYERSYPRISQLRERIGDVNLFLFNPRGVGESKGSPNGEKMPLDVHAAFRYLVDVEGFEPSDIIIFGYSLGGGYGAEGAALVQQDYPDREIHFVSYNSFKDLTTESAYIVDRFVPDCFFFLKGFCSYLVQKLIQACKWQMDPLTAVQKLKGKKLVIVNKSDPVIGYQASLYRGLKGLNRPLEIPVVKMDRYGNTGLQWNQHVRPFTSWESFEVGSRLKAIFQIPSSPSLDPSADKLLNRNQSPQWAKRDLKVIEVIDKQQQFLEGTPAEECAVKLEIAKSGRHLLAKQVRPSDLEYTPEALFSKNLHTLRQSGPTTENPSPVEEFSDYQRTLSITKVQVLLNLAGKCLEDSQRIEQLRRTLDLLEAINTDVPAPNGTLYRNYADLLYSVLYDQCRATPALAPLTTQANFGKNALLGTYPAVDAEARKRALETVMQIALPEGFWERDL